MAIVFMSQEVGRPPVAVDLLAKYGQPGVRMVEAVPARLFTLPEDNPVARGLAYELACQIADLRPESSDCQHAFRELSKWVKEAR